MKKVLLLFTALCLVLAGNAQIKTYSSNDSNLDGQVNISDVNSVINEMCGVATGKQMILSSDASASVNPYYVDNSLIVGKWYKTKGSYIEFKSDGTVDKQGNEWGYVFKDTTKFENRTYRFLPYQGKVLLCGTNNIPIDYFNVFDINSDYLALGSGQNRMGIVYKTQPAQPVTSITLSRTTLFLQPKAYEQLTATVSPSNADDASVTWTSSNTSVATVMGGIILAAAEGMATITCEANDGSDVKATCEVTVHTNKTGTIDGKQYVDLGLPSGTLWATCNVGATSPEEYGLYFAWGETVGYTSDTSDGHSFDWTNYKWCNGSLSTITKYCTSFSYGTVDNKRELEVADDAATANWGSNWQMPSLDQINELYNSSYTTTAWTTQNGVNGRLITSKTNGNTIFLPVAGYRSSASLYGAGTYGVYWSRTLYSNYSSNAYDLYFNSSNIDWYGSTRYYGQSVRPVRVQN